MLINWQRYVRITIKQDLTGIAVVLRIQEETNREVNISEIKRRLAGTESSTSHCEVDIVDVFDLIRPASGDNTSRECKRHDF